MTKEPQFFNIVFLILLFATIVTAIIILKSNQLISYFRKRQLSSTSNYLLRSNDYRVINNINLNTPMGEVHCDYIIVSCYGIFIIETFDYDGMVKGEEWEANWNLIDKRKKVRTFDNPLQPIDQYKKRLASLLGITKYEIFPMLVVIGSVNFTSISVENITTGKGLLKLILEKKRFILSVEKTQEIIKTIEDEQLKSISNQLTSNNDSSLHQQPKLNKCPSCGGEMMIELVQSGSNVGQQILRCSLFPTCKGSRNLI